MPRSDTGSLGRWTFASTRFSTRLGVEWRMHMSKVAEKIAPVRAPPSRWHR
jgi:hypothetical protein